MSALHLYNEPNFIVIGTPVILEQSHAHNAPDLWDRGSNIILRLTKIGLKYIPGMYVVLLMKAERRTIFSVDTVPKVCLLDDV